MHLLFHLCHCKYCNIKVLTGELTNDKCSVCGPRGTHRLPPLPPFPADWNTFIHHPNLGALSRTFNNLCLLTALGVYDGDFMHFDSGTLLGGRDQSWEDDPNLNVEYRIPCTVVIS
ncbi:hypothetical protein L208DRAFT_1401068 [Tricholoma matsutake]|nr:hypothetical protein L208DRAFT_1401068 [Tricholoma matsutake 945]